MKSERKRSSSRAERKLFKADEGGVLLLGERESGMSEWRKNATVRDPSFVSNSLALIRLKGMARCRRSPQNLYI
jgi:hypothetical protein